MGDRLMDNRSEANSYQKHSNYGSMVSHENMSHDGDSTKRYQAGHQNAQTDSSARTLSRKMNKKMRNNKSVFDEYEQRGGVLEDYEDLNDGSEDGWGREDHVLSQLYANQSDNQSGSIASYNL